MSLIPRSRTRAISSVLLLALLGACQELPHHPGRKVQILQQNGLEAANPSDVAVAPVEIEKEGVKVPDHLLREVIGDALVRRRYTPLAIEYVDSRVVDASYQSGTLGEDAVCRLIVHDWDERAWDTGRVLKVDLEMRMVDSRDPEGRVLWSARYPGQVDVTGAESHMTQDALYRHAIEQIAIELAGALPPRDTSPGRD